MVAEVFELVYRRSTRRLRLPSCALHRVVLLAAVLLAVVTLGVVAVAPSVSRATTTVSYFPPGQTPPPGMDFGLRIQGDGASESATVRILRNPFRFRVAGTTGPGAPPAATVVPGPGCTSVTSSAGDTGVECNEGGSVRVTAFLGEGRDSLVEATFPDVPLFPVMVVDGGGGNDEIIGGRGNDDLRGGPGEDRLGSTNDLGADIFRGDEGADTISARDGVRDVRVDCGSPLFPQDSATVDLADRSRGVPSNVTGCEFVESFAVDDGPPGRPTGRKLRVRRDGTVRVRVACPRDARVRCRGRVTARDPRRPSRALASARYEIRVGSSRRVRLRFTAAERALLRRRGRGLFTTREQGVSTGGKRTAERTLRIL